MLSWSYDPGGHLYQFVITLTLYCPSLLQPFTAPSPPPRFPLFGGWQTRYYIGYNLPSYEYLYRSGSHYLLNMRLLDHVMDDQVVGKITLRIVLPEGAK